MYADRPLRAIIQYYPFSTRSFSVSSFSPLRVCVCVCVCVCVLPKTVRRFARCRPIRPTMIPTFYRSRLNDNHRGHPPNRRCNRARGAPEPPQAP